MELYLKKIAVEWAARQRDYLTKIANENSPNSAEAARKLIEIKKLSKFEYEVRAINEYLKSHQ